MTTSAVCMRFGIALSATVHWLFDQHLISLADQYGLVVSHNKTPTELRGLSQLQSGCIQLPDDRLQWPSLAYVQRYRELSAG